MNTNRLLRNTLFVTLFVGIIAMVSSCFPTKYPINYQFGEFPDSVINLAAVNSIYDDYNSSAPAIINLQFPLVFSSNRYTQGEEYDLVDYNLFFLFDQTEGTFELQAYSGAYPFYNLTDLSYGLDDEFGPINGAFDTDQFLFCFASNRTGNMEIYTSYWTSSTFSGASPMDPTPFRIQGVNSPAYDAYPSFRQDFSQMIFCSNRDGNLDFYTVDLPNKLDIATWIIDKDTSYTATPVTDLNSPVEDVCPYINGELIVFTSKREGGYGGYDLWYAKVEADGFGEPVNFGPEINTEYDEFRPIVSYAQLFHNDLLIFSSNRPGGQGGFDLYYTGIPRMTIGN